MQCHSLNRVKMTIIAFKLAKKKQFELVTRFVAQGMYFLMAVDVVQDARVVCDILKLGFCSEYLVAWFVRTACAISIKILHWYFTPHHPFQWPLMHRVTSKEFLRLKFKSDFIKNLLLKVFNLSHLLILVDIQDWRCLKCFSSCLMQFIPYGSTS